MGEAPEPQVVAAFQVVAFTVAALRQAGAFTAVVARQVGALEVVAVPPAVAVKLAPDTAENHLPTLRAQVVISQ